MTSESESKGAGTGNAWDSFIGGSEDEHEEEFFSDWKDFCNDPRINEPLSKKVSTPRKAVLAKVLAGDKTIPQIADELGVTKATLYSALNIGSILKDHGIDQSEMSRYLRTDPDAILNPLKENKMRISKKLKESKESLITDICNQLSELDGGDDFINEYKLAQYNSSVYDWEYLDEVADALYEYGYESQAKQIWDEIANDRQGDKFTESTSSTVSKRKIISAIQSVLADDWSMVNCEDYVLSITVCVNPNLIDSDESFDSWTENTSSKLIDALTPMFNETINLIDCEDVSDDEILFEFEIPTDEIEFQEFNTY